MLCMVATDFQGKVSILKRWTFYAGEFVSVDDMMQLIYGDPGQHVLDARIKAHV